MKKIKSLFVIAFFAAVTILSSCIENEVSPEIEALRNAQLEMVQAKIEKQRLDNELAEAQNAFTVAMNEINIQAATANLELTMAQINAQLAEAEADLERAQLELQEAIDNLTRYLAENDLQEAADYLMAYSDYMEDYYDAQEDVYGQEAYIAQLNATFAQNDYELAREMIQRGLDKELEMLSVMEDVLATLEAVTGDPGTAADEIATALALIQELENENIQIRVDIQKFENDVLAIAYNDLYEAIGGWSYYNNVYYDGYVISPADLLILQEAYSDAVEKYNDMWDLIDANDDIIDAQSYLVDALSDQLYDIDELIEDVLEEIEWIKQDINFTEKLLADNQIDEDELTAQIANEEADLERLNNLKDALLALANQYWALYESALGN